MKRAISLILSLLLLLTAAPLTGVGELFATTANASINGETIYFGTYPQSLVTNSNLISILTNIDGFDTWKSITYYLDSTQSDYIKYTDLTYNGDKYRGVYFTYYGPDWTSNSPSIDNSYQDDNGYYTSNIYWFKYEPIAWTVLDEDTGLIVSNLILYSRMYYYKNSIRTIDGKIVYSNNWEYSSIRRWINDDFYNTAFSETEQNIIKTATLENNAYSTSYQEYDANNTEDKIFALSFTDAYKYWSYDTERRSSGTDYAKCNGVFNNASFGTSNYWLRSAGNGNYYACYVGCDGVVHYNSNVNCEGMGIRPALCLDLTSSNPVKVPSSSISLSKTALSLTKGYCSTLTATMSPDDTTDTVSWKSSNTSVATVSGGKVTAVSAGTATITATTTSGKTATCTVTVTVPSTSVSLSKTTLSLTKGNSSTLTATMSPSDTTDTVSWSSSNTSVATVSDGKVTAVAAGTATITATTTSGKTATCTVTVTVPSTSVSLSKTTLFLTKGNSSTLTATMSPSDTTDTVSWKSSNTSVATVSNGRVTAVGAGTATITATTTSGKTATCAVTVTVPSTSVSLNKTSLSLTKGNSSTLTATMSPSDTTDTVSWKSSNTSVATVLDGKVTAVGAGTATITVTTTSGKTATCTVTVTAPATSVSLSKTTLFLTKGNSSTLTATMSPSDTTDTVSWSSSNTSVATVSNGKVTAVAAGTATITATTTSGKTATCTVTVTVPSTSVSLNKTSLSLTKGNSSTLTATMSPSDTTDTVSWKSSNTSVATVSNGKVTAVAAGMATITATTTSGKTATCAVTVRNLNTYTVSYNANGGTGVPSAQTKTEGSAITLSSTKPTKSYTISFNANGGSVSPTSYAVYCTFNSWNTKADGTGTKYASGASYTNDANVTLYAQWTNPTGGTFPTPSRSGYTFAGWYTASNGGTRVFATNTVTASGTLYAHWTSNANFTITYNANGGTGAPSAQTKAVGKAITLSSTKPTKAYTISFNANGGSVSPASTSVKCTFNSWNTNASGTGTKYSSGASYTADADVTLYAQWTNPTAGNLPTPTRNTYQFDGWYTSANGGTKITSSSSISSSQTLYAHWKANDGESSFEWGKDNWNFNNSSYDGSFSSGTYRQQINNTYLKKLSSVMTNSEYNCVFGSGGWLDDKWSGSCYGMSSTTLLSVLGYLPYSSYKSGATTLNALDKPTSNSDVSSLITYYQMLQVKDVIQQQYRTVPNKSNEENINKIVSLLKSNPIVLIGFKKEGWGGHAILAYGYEYGSWTRSGVSYQGRIKICDPNSSKQLDEDAFIYFNTSTYNWAIPFYSANNMTSLNGAKFNYIGASVYEINQGGYLSGVNTNKNENFVARIDAPKISENRSVSKVSLNSDGSFAMMNTAPGDIIEDYSYVLGGESEGTIGYNLFDSESSYVVSQSNPGELSLNMDYEFCDMEAKSAAGISALFDNSGYVSVSGESADYYLAMTFDKDYPTDWFHIEVSGNGADNSSLKKSAEGYIVTSDNLNNVVVKANNRENSATTTFSTDCISALIYEIDSATIGVKVDTDNNGTYETELSTKPVSQTVTLGDVDGENGITVSDARLALRRAIKLEIYAEGTREFLACDVNADGKVDVSDARSILRVAIKLDSADSWKKTK